VGRAHMLKRVVVGVDGSQAGSAALGWAGRLAQRVGAEVVVAHAFEPDESELPPGRYDELRAEAECRLVAEWSAPLRSCDVSYRRLLLTGPPDRLLDAADHLDADLLVVGPRGHGGFAALHVGSVAHHLAHYARQPLAIVPAPTAALPLDRIVIGVDGSAGSMAAVRWCARLAAGLDAEVAAVCALERHAALAERAVAVCEEKLRDAWTAPLHDAGVKVHPIVREETHPVAALSAVVRDENAGLVVVGVRGLGGFLAMRLGRLPLQLVHQTQLPVVIVPARSTETRGMDWRR
jgi:nucleotide-binding universal stress UspA family protein